MKNPAQAISALRYLGVQVEIEHHRYVVGQDGREFPMFRRLVLPRKLPKGPRWILSPHGGLTRVVLTFPNGRRVVGRARCRDDENFNKGLGRRIALGRAFKQALELRLLKEVEEELNGDSPLAPGQTLSAFGRELLRDFETVEAPKPRSSRLEPPRFDLYPQTGYFELEPKH